MVLSKNAEGVNILFKYLKTVKQGFYPNNEDNMSLEPKKAWLIDGKCLLPGSYFSKNHTEKLNSNVERR
jgi:hypothetical protein